MKRNVIGGLFLFFVLVLLVTSVWFGVDKQIEKFVASWFGARNQIEKFTRQNPTDLEKCEFAFNDCVDANGGDDIGCSAPYNKCMEKFRDSSGNRGYLDPEYASVSASVTAFQKKMSDIDFKKFLQFGVKGTSDTSSSETETSDDDDTPHGPNDTSNEYTPAERRIRPHHHVPVVRNPVVASAPTDSGTAAESIQSNSRFLETIRQMIRSEVATESSNIKNQYEIQYNGGDDEECD